MIPALDKRGLLPAGLHHAQIAEVAGIFCTNPHREVLWELVSVRFLPELRLSMQACLPHVPPLVMGGSFFSDKLHPEDIEVTALFALAPGAGCWEAIQTFNRRHGPWKALYRVDYYPSLPGDNDFSSFFQYAGPKTAQAKGINAKDLRGALRFDIW